MKFQLTGEEAALKQGLQLLLEAKGHQLAEGGISIVPAPHPEKDAYRLQNRRPCGNRILSVRAFFPGNEPCAPASGGQHLFLPGNRLAG